MYPRMKDELHMSTSYFIVLCSLLPILVQSCSTYNFFCGNFTLEIQYPFFSDEHPAGCSSTGLHRIQCLNLVPLIRLHSEGFFFPVWNISYSDKSLVVHDLKLSTYFRGSNCVFLYNLTSPVLQFNVSNVSESLSSSQGFFNCETSEDGFSRDVFKELYNLTPCTNYSLYYSNSLGDQTGGHCKNSGGIWFEWRLAFDEDDGNVSLLSAGFSPNWTPFPDCFSCQFVAGNCSNQCRGVTPSGGTSHTTRLAIDIICGVGGFLLMCALCYFCYRRKLKQRLTAPALLIQEVSNSISKSFSKKDQKSMSFHCQTHLFSYEELVDATNDFDRSKELGHGGYGRVYKGLLRDGRVVAVKRLYETSYKRVEQFMNEVKILSCLRHPNLVTLYGSTHPSSPHLLLVYEFIPNGTLADHLHDPLRSKSLPLSLRLSMAIDTAAALTYLHSIKIIHRDVKSNNILIDDNFKVKVADFGLSRLFPAGATHISTVPQGTPGYLDPEYYQFFQLTDSSDVYSFGVVLMELICSRPAVDIGRQSTEISLAMAAVNKIQEGELGELVDPGLGLQSDQEAARVVMLMAKLAFRCLQMEREMRPSMREVLEVLREIEGRGVCCNADACELKVKEESRLLKHSDPFS